MHITARADSAVRLVVELAASDGSATKAESLAAAQSVPPKVLESVLADLRRAHLVSSRRGPDGGYWLARDADAISIADVIRVVDGPLASVRGERPEDLVYAGVAEPLQRVWLAVRTNIRDVLEGVTIGQVARGALPPFVYDLTADPGAWHRRQ